MFSTEMNVYIGKKVQPQSIHDQSMQDTFISSFMEKASNQS